MPRRALDQFIVDLLTDPMTAIGKAIPRYLEKSNPEMATMVRVAGKIAQRSAATMRLDNTAATQLLNDIKQTKYGVFPVIGLPGSGKTIFALWLADWIHNPNNCVIGMQDEQIPHYFHKLSSLSEIMALPKGTTVILDDVAQLASIYKYQAAQAQTVVDMVTLCRHLGLTIIVTGQNTTAINRHIFDVLNVFFFKVPNLSPDFERPAVRKFYRQVQEAFFDKTREYQQSHVFIWSGQYIGMVRYDASHILRVSK